MELKKTLQFLIEGGSVERYHTRPGLRADTDAQHSWGVAMLAYILAVDRGMDTVAGHILLAALTHDLGEQVACDVSAPAKVALGLNGRLGLLEDKVRAEFGMDFSPMLTDEERRIIKLADSFECVMYCCKEAALGNRNVVLVYERSCTYLEEQLDTDFEWELYQALQQIWEESNGNTFSRGPAFDCFATAATPNHKPGKRPASRRPALQRPAAATTQPGH